MKGKRTFTGTLLAVLLLALAVGPGWAQGPEPPVFPPVGGAEAGSTQGALGTDFTYQGRLADGGSPADGPYDLQFWLYDAATGGSQVGSAVTRDNVDVSDGLFTVELDFGDVFDGTALWMQVAVRPGSSTGTYTPLVPRQALTAAPYALYAVNIPAHDHWGEEWEGTGTGTGLTLFGGDIGITASGSSRGVLGHSDSSDGHGVFGVATATSGYADGVYGGSASTDGHGVTGYASAASGPATGVYGQSDSTEGSGVFGNAMAASGQTHGVHGQSASTGGSGVFGNATATSGEAIGVVGHSHSISGTGVFGNAMAASGHTKGVYGESASPEGNGVLGWATATSGPADGVAGVSESTEGSGVTGVGVARGVFGRATATSGYADGVYGRSASTDGHGVTGYASAASGPANGVFGESESTDGTGVFGLANAASGGTRGVQGQSNSPDGAGVYGIATATSGEAIGVVGHSHSISGTGVLGNAMAASGHANGVYGESASPEGNGVLGWATATSGPADGVAGVSESTEGSGVTGVATAASGPANGVFGESESTEGTGVFGLATAATGAAHGVHGESNSLAGYGVYGTNPAGGYAGYFSGDVEIAGHLNKGSGTFKIDHPLDPENKYLYHSFVESPDMMNVYNGNVTTDDEGFATVTLPDYFEALNRDYRYQLTVIGTFAQAIVAQEIEDGQFVIRTDQPNVKVSWQVTGIRQDPYAEANPILVEEEKPTEEQGTYLHPEVYAQPEEMGLDYERNAGLMKQAPETSTEPGPTGSGE